jgi:hypothetical protein
MTRPSPSSALTLRPPGRRGRHLGLLLVAALAAAFLLVPAAQAAAANSLTITEVGTGTGSTVVECEEGTGFTTCAAPLTELPEGKEVKVTATADPGSEIGTVRGNASAEGCTSSPCTFVISENSEVIVEFKPEAIVAHGFATVEIAGEGEGGEGEVSSVGGFSGFYEGTPAIECHGAEPGEGQCEAEMEEFASFLEGKDAIGLHAVAAPGSEFKEWVVEAPAVIGTGCTTPAICLAYNTTGSDVHVIAVFVPATGPTPQPLTLTTSGTGAGSFECEDITAAGSTAPCASGDDFPEGDEVKVIPVEGAGSEFVEFNGENAGECSGATCTVTMSGPKSVNAKFDIEPVATQPLAIEVEGEGEVISSPAGISCTEGAAAAECEEDFAESSEVELEADADPGWQFAGWTTVAGTEQGSCENTATPCTTGALGEAVTLKATFTEIVLPEFPLEVTVAGEGEVTGPTIACTESGGTCIEERKETETVTLTAAAEPGSHFVGWTGVACTGGNTSTTCSFTMPASAVNVEAEFAVTTTSPLTVFVTGEGEVSSTSPIGEISGCTSAGGSECEGQYEGPVTLTATPQTGWVLAGWVGCRHTGGLTCEVTVNAEREVYAVFLKEGTEGGEGEPGKGVVIGTATAAECPEGGITVEVEGEPSTKKAICNGEEGLEGQQGNTGQQGSPGTPGSQGPAGPTGAAGATGATGPAGPAGAKGDTGAAGAQGPAGATGPQGPAGKNAKVTCKVTQKKGGKKVKVTCTVKYQGGGAKSSSLHWRLSHGGHTVRRGSAHGAGRLNLGHLRPGRYVLHVQVHLEAFVVH